MSLVAYGSSDDSDESDQEEAHVPSKPVESTSTPVIHAQGIGGSLAQDSAFPRSEDPPISDEDDDDFMVTDQPHPGEKNKIFIQRSEMILCIIIILISCYKENPASVPNQILHPKVI